MQGQIKIGDNPQNLDPSSVLELESNSRVLVITRMTTTQMENTSPLRGALVYNTDTQCVHFYTGTLWENLCNRPDEQTFTTDAIVNFSPTLVITQDGSNFNFEVGEIRGENIVDTSINGEMDIQPGSITGQQLQDASISFDKLAIGDNTGEILQWNGAQWTLVDIAGLSVTEIDGIVGNEVVGPFDTTLRLEGTGDSTNPFLLDVSVGGIGTSEIANDAVTANKIDVSVAGTGLNQAVDGSLEVDVATFADGDVTSTDGTIALTGTTTNAIFEDINFDVADNAITNAKMADDAINTDEIVDDAVTADKIDVSVAGTGLNQAVDGSLEVDVATFADGDITSTDGTIALTGTTTNAIFEDINFDVADNAITNAKMADNAINTDEIVDDAVTADKIDVSVAGTGLNQAVDGSLEVDVATFADGDITSTDGTIVLTGTTTNAIFEDVNFDVADNAITNAKMADDAINTDEIVDDAVTADKIGTTGVTDANKVLGTDTAGEPQWQDAANLATSLGQDVTSTNGSITGIQADAALVAMDLEVNVDGTTIEVDATNGLQIPDNAITNAKMADDAINTDEIVDDAVTANKIGTTGVTDANKVLGTDTAGDPQWQDAANLATSLGQDVTSTNGSITGTQADAALVAMDLEVNVDGTTIEVDATNGLQVPDGGITLAKLADAAADDQILQWNATSTAWELADGSALQQTINGTLGSIFFSDGAGSLLENNTNLFWDNTFDSGNGALGLGTTTPQTKLHIREAAGNNLTYGLQLQNANNNASGGSAAGILFSVEATGNFGKGALVYERNQNFAKGDFHFLQNIASTTDNPDLTDAVMTIKNTGEVGIGELNPNAQLHVKRSAGNNLFYGLQLQNSNNNNTGGSASGILFAVEATGNYGKGALVYERKDQNAKGDFHFLQNDDNNQNVPDLSHAIMTIKNDGKVGVGTTAPNSTLQTTGSFSAPIVSTLGNTTLDASHYTVILDGLHSITLPVANTCQGRIYIIKNPTAFNPTISSYFDSVGASTTTIPTGVVQLQSDGTNWQQIN
ncbi:hypothetical protein AAY42_07395 [Flagellimonas eckloniae]|uniref:Uncharacterized protein n=2 Tax=Flagellimonas eckloniae TaxID=346185 RepID=A0A0Q0WW62_9FLAO|nr:hypothetical protein AAY42_07395 [Allomuricauda eckloniae]